MCAGQVLKIDLVCHPSRTPFHTWPVPGAFVKRGGVFIQITPYLKNHMTIVLSKNLPNGNYKHHVTLKFLKLDGNSGEQQFLKNDLNDCCVFASHEDWCHGGHGVGYFANVQVNRLGLLTCLARLSTYSEIGCRKMQGLKRQPEDVLIFQFFWPFYSCSGHRTMRAHSEMREIQRKVFVHIHGMFTPHMQTNPAKGKSSASVLHVPLHLLTRLRMANCCKLSTTLWKCVHTCVALFFYFYFMQTGAFFGTSVHVSSYAGSRFTYCLPMNPLTCLTRSRFLPLSRRWSFTPDIFSESSCHHTFFVGE